MAAQGSAADFGIGTVPRKGFAARWFCTGPTLGRLYSLKYPGFSAAHEKSPAEAICGACRAVGATAGIKRGQSVPVVAFMTAVIVCMPG